MFRNWAEKMVLFLTKKNVLSENNGDVNTYAMEVILLNTSLLGTIFIISLYFGEIIHFLSYVIFFIPLRVFSGGYHSKRSEACFILSNVMYTVTLITSKYMLLMYKNKIVLVSTLIMMIMTMVFSPIENINHPLTKERRDRNKSYIKKIVFIDFALLLLFVNLKTTIASREIIFILLNGMTLMAGKAKASKSLKTVC